MQGVTSRSWVSFIMWTGAAYRASCMACISGLRCEPVHICYLASDLFIDAVRTMLACGGKRGTRKVCERNHFPFNGIQLLASVSAIETLPDGRRRLRWPAIPFHLDRPCFRFGPVGSPVRFRSLFPRALRANLRAPYSGAKYHLSRFGAHGGDYSGLCEPGQCHYSLRTGTSAEPYRSGKMCNLYSITTNQAAIAALFRVMNQYVGNLPPMPWRIPRLPGSGRAQRRRRARDGPDALGNAASATDRRPARHQHQEHIVPALAWMAETGKPMPGPRQQLCGICAGAEPRDQKEGRCLVRAQ